MSYAKIVSAPKSFAVSTLDRMLAFGLVNKALWGDVDAYDPKMDGPHEAYFLESARKRPAVLKEVSPEDLEAEKQHFKENVERKERLIEQARLKAEQEHQEKIRQATLCKCGCGKAAHLAPRPDFAGYCCGWCKKHNGKRGHGEACGK